MLLGSEQGARRYGRAAAVALASSAALGAMAFVVGLALASGAACLPDLSALPELDAGPPPIGRQACGDGIIETLADGGGETCDPGDASTPGCQSCQVRCDEGELDRSTGHCYFLAGSGASFQEALARCSASGAHLVTLDSDAEASFVGDRVARGAGYWIGLSFEAALEGYGTRGAGVGGGLEPGWPEPARGSGPCTGCFGLGRDGGGFDALDDAGDEGGASTFACVASSGGRWYGVPCVGPEPLATLCEREPRGQRAQACGGGLCFTLPASASRGKSYVVVLAPDTADEAEKTCASLAGGRLVVLESPEEREELVRELLQIDPLQLPLDVRAYWIGLSRQAGGPWKWDDGRAGLDPPPWSDSQPGAAPPSARAFLDITDYQYDTGLVSTETSPDASPTVTRPYVCERAP